MKDTCNLLFFSGVWDTISGSRSLIIHHILTEMKNYVNTGQVAIVLVPLSITVSCCHLGINRPVFSYQIKNTGSLFYGQVTPVGVWRGGVGVG